MLQPGEGACGQTGRKEDLAVGAVHGQEWQAVSQETQAELDPGTLVVAWEQLGESGAAVGQLWLVTGFS